jgi:ankyrin repeat protein
MSQLEKILVVSDATRHLMTLARTGHLFMLECHIANSGVDINSLVENGFGVLHSAVMANNNANKVVSMLIEKGANVNAKTSKGVTPLHSAAAHGGKALVKLLLDNGAEINAKTKTGETPADWAKKIGNTETLALLQKMGGTSKE